MILINQALKTAIRLPKQFILFFIISMSITQAQAEKVHDFDSRQDVLQTNQESNEQITQLAKFIITKFKLLNKIDKQSNKYESLHEEIYGQYGLVDSYLELTDYDIDKMGRMYASVGGINVNN